MSFPGSNQGTPGMGSFGNSAAAGAPSAMLPGGGATEGMSEQEAAMIKTVQKSMESCPVKAVISSGMGFALGGVFGLFMSSMAYDNPLTPQGAALSSLPVREQLKRGFKDMGNKSFSSAKNFAIVGGLFSGTECAIEALRAKNDMKNGVAAGCITGGVLAASAGPQAAALGCAGFAAFSAAIDAWMRQPSDE